MSLLTTSAVLLRSYPFSETSQILRFYSESEGLLSTVARGVRKTGGRKGGSLSTFSEGILNVHFRENRDLQTFQDFAPRKTRKGLARDPVRLTGASVLAELILQHAESEGNPELFERLAEGLDAMEAVELEGLLPGLLVHLWSLIQGLGFGPMVRECVECGRAFRDEDMGRFDFAAGGLRCSSCQGDTQGPRLGPIAREHLQALLEGKVPDGLVRPKTHLRLASDFLTYHISGGAPLRSITVLDALIPETDA